jgi:hypothetical protein
LEVKTVQISDERYWQAKKASAIQKKSLKEFLEDVIASSVETVKGEQSKSSQERSRCPQESMEGD